MCSGTYVSVGPLAFELGSERLIATKWFYDSLLRYPAHRNVSTAVLHAVEAVGRLERNHSRETNKAPFSTAVPGATSTLRTRPDAVARSSFSIFIASMTTTP